MRWHRKTAAVWADNDCMATYARLLVMAMEQYAAKRDGVVRLTPPDLLAATGRRRRDYALLTLSKLVAMSPLSLSCVGADCLVTIPNYARKQGIGGQNSLPQNAESRKQKAEKMSDEQGSLGLPPIGSKSPQQKPSEKAKALAVHLRGLIEARLGSSGARKPAAWALQLEKLHAKGQGPSWDAIEHAIDWCYGPENDTEYRIEVQSATALRDKWSRIQAAIQRSRRGGGNGRVLELEGKTYREKDYNRDQWLGLLAEKREMEGRR